MPSDSQNKMERPDGNVVALHRAEFVAGIEKKLSEARRFFSLHDYRACEELVLEVLAADPQNSKAKALLELSSIKLSKRKLYKKIVEPKPAAELPCLTEPVEKGPAHALPLDSALGLQPEDLPPAPLPAGVPTAPLPAAPDAPRRRRRGVPDTAAGGPPDSMRERTISALVDLLKQKETTLQDWQGSHQAKADASAPPVESLLAPEKVSKPIPADKPVLPAKSKAPQPPAPGPLEPRPSVLPANSDFLPGSLDELFTQESLKHVLSPVVEPSSTATPASVPSLKSPSAPTAPVPPPPAPAEAAPVIKPFTEMAPSILKEAENTPAFAKPAPGLPAPKKDTAKKPLEAPAFSPNVVQLPDVRIFDQITAPRPLGHEQEVERKIGQRSEELKNSEIKAGSIAQIKKYLYQEEYDLCARDLERIRSLFPQNAEIQAFVENTSKRLVELQRIKAFEIQAKDLMASAVVFYQEGKLEEALIAVREILRVNPHHVQAREFVSFVERHQSKEKKRQPTIQKVRACRACGTEVDAVSQFCYHCGKRLG
ncbi:MAG: hypothetical protein L0338_26930 [Acidobacteria bacterium]|nr:hypothetical protein [Acidobacteriota bacterium]